jgi:hypothetical protein
MIFSPIRVGEKLERSDGDSASFNVENRYSFTNLSQIKGKWQLLAANKSIDTGDFTANVMPLSSGRVSIHSAQLDRADALRIDFGDVVAHQFTLKEPQPEPSLSAELPQGLAFPKFNLLTRLTEKDPGMWKKVTRYTAQLAEPNSTDTSLEANIVMDNNPSKVVGNVKARYEGNRFIYRLEWTGPKADVQELGWIFTMPRSNDRFSWNRDALWTVYPQTHIGRPSGTARPDSMNVPLSKVTRPDAYDFNSTKYNCRWASLTDESGDGLRVQFTKEDRHHCRGGVSDAGNTLTVNKLVIPPTDISTNVVPELYMTLNKGDKVDGAFSVGK